MSLTPSRKPSSQRRRSVGTSGGRYPHSEASSTHTYPGRVRAPEGSPTARTYPTTPRRQTKHAACSDNHGIRPPVPEQYLTPLQQKEVCIRHLRARLRENVERLQHRDCEIDELRTQLYKMQEDWIEEECHRVEAQLALKEARREIQHLQEVVESVRSNLGLREPPPPDRSPLAARPGGKSRSCGCSPAGTLSRGPPAAPPPGQPPLLLEAALLPEPPPQRGGRHLPAVRSGLAQQDPHHPQPPAGPRPPAYDRLRGGGGLLPVSHSCHALSSGCACAGPAYLPPHHHHLFLHLPQEEPPVTAAPRAGPAPPEVRPEVRSQACSPTMSWLLEEGEQLSFISLSPPDPRPPGRLCSRRTCPPRPPPENSCRAGPRPPDHQLPSGPRTCQPQAAQPPPGGPEAGALDESVREEAGGDRRPPQRCHWSRYFLVDLLALAMPVVPTVAWLCRGAPQEVLPVHHIGSLLRGCCAVALHSLRRQGGGPGAPEAPRAGAPEPPA
ncbi:LOW QUALITY PROTEIN: syntaphilin [Menidia menidia]